MNKTGNNKYYFNKGENGDRGRAKKNDEFLLFANKCEELKIKTKNLLDKYTDLSDSLYNKSKIKLK